MQPAEPRGTAAAHVDALLAGFDAAARVWRARAGERAARARRRSSQEPTQADAGRRQPCGPPCHRAGKGMTLEDLQKKFETQAAVAELLKMLRPNTEQPLHAGWPQNDGISKTAR